MEDEFQRPRDAESDMVEIASRLGEPNATYRTSSSSVIWRFSFGVLIVLVAAALHFLVWSGTVPWPNGIRPLLFILAGMFVGPGVGLYLISFAVRGMKLWVMTYPTGIFVWHRGRVLAFPWDEIRVVQFSGIPDKAVLERTSAAVWFDLDRSGRRMFGTTITLTRGDGEQITLMSTLEGFPELGKTVQQETYRRLFAENWGRFVAGETLAFGVLTCDRVAITVGKQSLAWKDLASVERVSDQLHIKRKGKKKPWAKCELAGFVNLHVFLGIPQAAGTSTPADRPTDE